MTFIGHHREHVMNARKAKHINSTAHTENKVHRRYIFIAKETKKPRYLDFYDLDSFREISLYEKQTVRLNGKWYFVEGRIEDFIENPKTNIFIKPLGKQMNEFLV